MPRLSDRLIEQALKWKGTPWVDGGRSPSGIDCLGLLVVSVRDAGLPVQDHTELRSQSGMKMLVDAALRYCDEIPVRDMRRGALLLAHIKGERDAKHIMIYDGYAVIHCGMHWNKVVHHRLDDDLRRSVKRAWVFKEEYECLDLQ